MARTKKAWLILSNDTVTREENIEGRELSLVDVYPLIGEGCDTTERVMLKKGVEMWVDEDGVGKGLQLNITATGLYRDAYPHMDPRELGIVGNAVVIDNTKNGDFMK